MARDSSSGVRTRCVLCYPCYSSCWCTATCTGTREEGGTIDGEVAR